MQSVKRKAHRSGSPKRNRLLLLACLLALAAALPFLLRPEQAPVIDDPETGGDLAVFTQEEIQTIAVTLPGGGHWSISRNGEGRFIPDGCSWQVSETMLRLLLTGASGIHYERIVAESPDAYDTRLADFGLDHPLTAAITCTGQRTYIVHFGGLSPEEGESRRYMTVEGNPRLFEVDAGTYDSLNVALESLHPVEQPDIQKSRIAAVRCFQNGVLKASWSLEGSIADGNAADHWIMTYPCSYPADGEIMANVRTNLSNLRMGAYTAPADQEGAEKYGLDQPSWGLEIHLQAGTVNRTDADGSVAQLELPEETVVLTVGDMKNENVYYVQYRDAIYTVSRFSIAPVLEMDPMETVSRYPVTVPLSELSALTAAEKGAQTVYQVEHRQRAESEQELAACWRNGEPCPPESFEAAYLRLETVRVTGRLPEGWVPAGEPDAVYTFRTLGGKQRTVELYPFDPLHQAVSVDGSAVFYIVKDAFSLQTE